MSIFPLFRKLPPLPRAGEQNFWVKWDAHRQERYRRMGCGLMVIAFGLVLMILSVVIQFVAALSR